MVPKFPKFMPLTHISLSLSFSPVCLFNYQLGPRCVPGSILSARDTARNNAGSSPLPWRLHYEAGWGSPHASRRIERDLSQLARGLIDQNLQERGILSCAPRWSDQTGLRLPGCFHLDVTEPVPTGLLIPSRPHPQA